MGSDLARLLHLQDADSLPPFRNVSPGPPKSLPSLAQLGCSIPSPALPPSWTAVNHPHSSRFDTNSGTDTTVDRAPLNDHPNVASSESTPQLSNHHSPLRPKSTSHLGRRVQHPSLAPRKPNGAARQDSVTPESPSPKVPSESLPEVAPVLLSKETNLASRPSHAVDPPVPSPVLDAGLSPAPPGRAALPHSTVDTAHQHYHHSALQHSFLESNQPTSKPASRTRRKPMPSHPRELSISAPTASSLPKPAARPRRRAASNRSVEHPNSRTVAGGQSPNSKTRVMLPPSLSDRNGFNPTVAGPSSYREPLPSRSSQLVSDVERIMPPSFTTPQDPSARLPVSLKGSGYATQATDEEAVPEAPSLRANQSSSPADADPPSPENEAAADRGLRCRVCSLVYGPFSLETAHAEWRTTQNQSQASLSDMIREFPTVKRLHYDNWIEQHQHDPALHRVKVAVRQPYASSHDNTLHSNKRKRPADEDHPPNSRPTHYATKDSSGVVVWYTEGIARIFGVNGVPGEPYTPAPKDDTNLWREPHRNRENMHDETRASSGNNRLTATPGTPDDRQTPTGQEKEESEPTARRLPTRKPGVAPLTKIID